MKKILIISNNCLSFTRNNGKTLNNIFKELLEQNKICNLYFSYEEKEVNIPTYNINEKTILHLKSNGKLDGVSNSSNIRHSEIIRLIRELIWLIPTWKKILEDIILSNKISTVFFLAGDSVFAYRIVLYLKKKYKLPLIVYYTDDYYFKHYDGIGGWLRKKIICKYISKLLNVCDKLFVISPKMQKMYNSIFKTNAKLLGIVPEKILESNNIVNKDELIFTYIGNLGLGRFDVICKLSDLITRLNKEKGTKYKVRIFTNTKLDEEKRRILKNDHVILGGGLNEQQVERELSDSDFLIFVESFDKKMIEITKYSFSTKVMEYLAHGKNIISIGPNEASSIELLSEVSINFANKNYCKEELYKNILNTKKCRYKKHLANELYNYLAKQFNSSKKEIIEYFYEINNK